MTSTAAWLLSQRGKMLECSWEKCFNAQLVKTFHQGAEREAVCGQALVSFTRGFL